MKKILHYLATLVFLLITDLVWINFVIMPIYQEQLAAIIRQNAIAWSAVAAWLLIPLGIVLFAVPKSTNWKQSLVYGALYGLILYGVYDFTNYAVLAPYTLEMTLLDIAWGTFLCSITSFFSWFLSRRI